MYKLVNNKSYIKLRKYVIPLFWNTFLLQKKKKKYYQKVLKDLKWY